MCKCKRTLLAHPNPLSITVAEVPRAHDIKKNILMLVDTPSLNRIESTGYVFLMHICNMIQFSMRLYSVVMRYVVNIVMITDNNNDDNKNHTTVMIRNSNNDSENRHNNDNV